MAQATPEFTEIIIDEMSLGTEIFTRADESYLGFVGRSNADKAWVFYPDSEAEDSDGLSAAILSNIAAYLQYLS